MKPNRPATGPLAGLLLALLLLLPFPCRLQAADAATELLPPDSCAPGWKVQGRPVLYDRETLSERIDGEAELYFPYGFERLTAGRYDSAKTPGAGMDVELYAMGSELDAYGMYANYRQKEGSAPGVGAESNLAGSQLYFYLGRYFVHFQITGSDAADPAALVQCGRTVAARLPGPASRPSVLSALDRPEFVKGSERYLPESLLGYDFLNRGLMADAVVQGANLQVFLLLGTTPQSATTAFERYRSQLTGGKVEGVAKEAQVLEGVDPLYGPVVVLKKGPCLAGALKFSTNKGVRGFLETLCR